MDRANRSRTITTLAVLVVAMGAGAFVLVLMETPPARPPVLQASPPDGSDAGTDSDKSHTDMAALIRRTSVHVQPIKWRNIVLYDASDNLTGLHKGCHFLIGASGVPGEKSVRSTGLWRRQLDGNHVLAGGYPYNNENSIGIALFCDTSLASPTSVQVSALTDLVRALQIICRIPSDRVYLRSNKPGAPGRLGRFFPFETFRSRLITARR